MSGAVTSKDTTWTRFVPPELNEASREARSYREAVRNSSSRSPCSTSSRRVEILESLLMQVERLQQECAGLRREFTEMDSDQTHRDTTIEELRSQLLELRKRVEKAEARTRQRSITAGTPEGAAQVGCSPPYSETFQYMAGVVAGYLWTEPTGAQTTLVKDALRARGLHQLVVDASKAGEAASHSVEDESQMPSGDVTTSKEMIPICASCKRVRDEQGAWIQVESFIEAHTNTVFTHGYCPDCLRTLYPETLGRLSRRDQGDKEHA